METLVVKILKKHFKLFIKNFKAEQLSVYASKGEGQMTDLELNEQVIQELLYIPMNLTVTKSSCDLLTLKIPWTSLSSKPVTLTLNRVDIDLREPEVIKPRTEILKKLKKKPEKNNSRSDVTDNAQLIVNSVHITIQTLGGSLLMVDLEDIVIQSTNGSWQVVDLSNSRTIDKEQGLEYLYKKLSVRSITMALLTERSAHMILQQMPLQIQLTQKRRLKDATLLAAEIGFVLEDVKFRWTRPEWLLMVDLARGFQQCLSRPVPESPTTTATPLSPVSSPPLSPSGSSGNLGSSANLSNSANLLPVSPDVSFSLRLDKWTIDFVEAMQSEKGYSFFGKALVVVFNSAKSSVQRIPNDKTGETITAEVDETVISININTVNFRELLPRSHVHPHIVSHKDQGANEATAQHLLKASLTLRRPVEADASTKYVPLIGIELALALSNLQIVADRKVWKGLIRFMTIPRTPQEKAKEDEERERELKEGIVKEAEEALAVAQTNLSKVKDALRLGEDWFNQIKLSIKASDIRLVIPHEEKGLYQNVSLHLDLGNFSMGNFSDWKITPNLSKGIALLAAPLPAPPVTTPKSIGVPQKLTFQIEGVSIAVHAGGRVANLLAPTGVKLFVHYYDRETKSLEKGKPNLEVIFQSGEFNLQANQQQFKYLAFVGRKYLSPRKIKSALSVRVEQAKEVAQAKITQEIKEFQDSVPKDDMVTPISNKVQSTLDAYKWVVYIHFNKGTFRVPLQFFLADEPEAEVAPPPAPVITIEDTPLGGLMAEPLVPAGPSIEELLGGTGKDSCELKYESMDLAFENNVNGQGAVIQLGSFQATGLDHPKLPSVITLLPLKVSDEEKAHSLGDVESLVFRYKRKRKQLRPLDTDAESLPDDEYLTDVWFRLQGMQLKIGRKPEPPVVIVDGVKVSSKPDHPGIQTGMGLPDIQALVNKAVSLLQERQSDIEVLRKNAEKVNFDVKWGVEVGNCEVLLEKQEGTGKSAVYKPYGTVRLSDAQRHSLSKSYFELETQLIKAKSSLAMQENAKEDFQTTINKLQAALNTVEADKADKLKKLTEEFNALEAKFVTAKVTIAQSQMENDNLQNQLNKQEKSRR